VKPLLLTFIVYIVFLDCIKKYEQNDKHFLDISSEEVINGQSVGNELFNRGNNMNNNSSIP
jgi:hypothetical protein